MLVLKGEIGYPSALTAPKWGFYDVSFKGQPFKFQRAYGSYVMENVLFKISFPAEFHAQTAVEAAVVAEELGRGLANVSYIGPTLAADLRRLIGAPAAGQSETVALSRDVAIDADVAGEAEDALAEDVAHDLGRAALDRVRAAPQERRARIARTSR